MSTLLRLQPRELFSSIVLTLKGISAPDHPKTQNPLDTNDYTIKNLFITLHCLFPNEILPALDLLDQRLVTRFVRRDRALGQQSQTHLAHTDRSAVVEDASNSALTAASEATRVDLSMDQERSNILDDARLQAQGTVPAEVYYVRSSRPLRVGKSGHAYGSVTNYEVRLCAWNCSCPAFTFATFSGRSEPTSVWLGGDDESGAVEGFGGLRLHAGVPVCKHLLACVLVENCPLFADCFEQKEASTEELAGWAAGWGD